MKKRQSSLPEEKTITVVSSYSQAVEFSDVPLIIGERINPTGKKRLKEALRSHDLEYILREGIVQEEKGAHILDVNTGLPDINEKEVMTEVIMELQSVTSIPLQIDTVDIPTMERAMRFYNGKPMINSVNGKKESMDAVFPLIQKYGGVVVALTLDENGIPDTAEGRADIAGKIICEAGKYRNFAKRHCSGCTCYDRQLRSGECKNNAKGTPACARTFWCENNSWRI